MMPQTNTDTRTPAWPGGGAPRPARNLPCGPKPDRDRDAWYVTDIDIDGARGPERERERERETSPIGPGAADLGSQ